MKKSLGLRGFILFLIFLVFNLTAVDSSAINLNEKKFNPQHYKTLQDCIDAASSWGVHNKGTGVVVFSGITYTVSGSLNLGSNIRLQGIFKGAKTILKYIGPQAASDTDFTGVLNINANKKNITIANIEFTRLTEGQAGTGFSGIFKVDVAVKVENPVSNIKIKYCKVTDYSSLFMSANMAKWSSNIEIGNCEAVNNQAFFSHIITTKNLSFHDNVIEQKNVGNSFIHAGAIFRGIQYADIVNNQLNQNGGGRAFNGFYFESVPALTELGGKLGGGASNINLVIAGNKINRTKEEGILIDRSRTPIGTEYNNVADVVSATRTTLTKTSNSGYGSKGIKSWITNCWKDLTVVIINGKGIGQVRQVAANTTTTLTIETAWDLIPDTTSIFVVTYHTNNVFINKNIINNTGKAAIAPYLCCGTTVSNNVITNCMNHMWDASTIEMMCPDVGGQFGDDDGVLWPNYNNIIVGNTISKQQSMIGIRVGNTNFNSNQLNFRHGVSTYNISIKNNYVNMYGATNGPNPIDSDVTNFSGSVAIAVEGAYGSTLKKVIIQNNTVSNARYGIWVGSQFEDTGMANVGKLEAVEEYNNHYRYCLNNLFITSDINISHTEPLRNVVLNK